MGEPVQPLYRSYLAGLWLAALLFGSAPALAAPAATPTANGPDRAEQALSLQLSERGLTALVLPCPAGQQILQLRIEGAGALEEVWLERLPASVMGEPDARAPGPFRGAVVRLPLAEAAAAAAADTRCRLVLRGLPAAQVSLAAVDWKAITLSTRLVGMWHDWAAFRPWGAASINLHPTVVQSWHGLSPNVLLGVLALLVGIAGFWRWRSAFLLWWMLACWLVLDLPWQWRLLQQVDATRDRFAGVPAADRPGATDDADLWAFAERAKALLPAGEASRIFVASASDYGGMRTAYYLYPLNVYWRRGGPELPTDPDSVRTGDYIVVVQPSRVRFLPSSGGLLLEGQRWRAGLLFEADDIGLYEVH